SSQLTGVPPHAPLLQVSDVVQTLPSSHEPLTGACWQPVDGSQESAVHGFPSSQSLGVPRQFPPLQASSTVQTFPSSHGPGTLVRVHAPVAGSQASSVRSEEHTS